MFFRALQKKKKVSVVIFLGTKLMKFMLMTVYLSVSLGKFKLNVKNMPSTFKFQNSS